MYRNSDRLQRMFNGIGDRQQRFATSTGLMMVGQTVPGVGVGQMVSSIDKTYLYSFNKIQTCLPIDHHRKFDEKQLDRYINWNKEHQILAALDNAPNLVWNWNF